jgi:hypothetical protein
MTSHALLTGLRSLFSTSIESVVAMEQSSLESLLERVGQRVVLFGAGSVGTKALPCLRGIGVEPLAFSDNNPARWRTEVEGVPVLSPQEAASRYGTKALFIVTIWNPSHWYVRTREQLDALGCTHVVPPAAIFWRFPDTFLPFYAQDLPHKIYEQSNDVLEAALLWADDPSREEYRRQVIARTGGPWAFPVPSECEESYFLDSQFRLNNEAFIDCGAFNGDTLRAFLSHCNCRFRSYTAIEADTAAFAALNRFVGELDPDIAGRIQTVNAFVGADPACRREGATVSIADLCVPSTPMTFIKMDVEGAERNALIEARTVIEQARPVLAICAYHKPDDLWSLPLLIKEMVPGHRMFLRSYEGDGWQTVVYAVPPERCVLPAV